MEKKCRAIAFYLPQYYPIKENDEWWGKGFTEWTNVTRAKPLFPGHRQPNLPADLGFYDLRLPQVRQQQADLARAAGIEGFCYWHYWFGAGRKLLEMPITEVIKSGKPDFPFCLCWANVTWSGIWYGAPEKILMEQQYLGEKDYEAYFYDTLPAFRDSRYMKVDGKPIFVVYRPSKTTDWPVFVSTFRRLAEKEGFPGLYLIGLEGQMQEGLDGMAPNLPSAGISKKAGKRKGALNTLRNGAYRVHNYVGIKWLKYPKTYPYSDFVNYHPAKPLDLHAHPTVLPNWDNTPRSGRNGLVLTGATPQLFEKLLHKIMGRIIHKPYEHRLLFIKAWNEWAEGNYLEPDQAFGHGWLDACRKALNTVPEKK